MNRLSNHPARGESGIVLRGLLAEAVTKDIRPGLVVEGWGGGAPDADTALWLAQLHPRGTRGWTG